MIKNRYIGLFSDIHLGIGQDDKKWHKISLDFAEWASAKFKKAGIKEIIIPGDVFHNRSEISVETLSVAKQFFDYFKEFTIYISAGNHDCYKKESTDVNSISIFDGWNNIHIIDKNPIILETNFTKSIALVPWATPLDKIPKCDILIGHFEINSFYMNAFKVCEHGHSYKNLFEISPCVISGHFHKRDHRKYENGQIYYLGSPFQHNFGDSLDSRGIYIFDIVENNFGFVENNISPKHFRLTQDTLKNNLNLIENNHISLVLTKKINHDDFISLQTNIANKNPLSLRTDYDEPEADVQIDTNKKLDSNDLLKNIEDYIETLDIENKKEVVDYVKELYNSLI